jgi:dihydrofolate reductase
MKIRTHLGISADGYISGPDGIPAQGKMPTFVPGASHGHPAFIKGCDAVVMGRTTFLPALGAPSWPWPGLRVFVLTSTPLPPGTPSHVITSASPAAMLDRMREAGFSGDVHLVGGQKTVQAFLEIGALDSLGLIVLPLLLGDGTPLLPPGTGALGLTLESQQAFPDGSVELTYTPEQQSRG